MKNPLNHFSDVGKRVLAAEIQPTDFLATKMPKRKKRGKPFLSAKGDQICDVRPNYSTVQYNMYNAILYCTVLRKLVLRGYKLVRAQQPVERARLGFVPMSSPGVTVMRQGQEGKFAPERKNSAPIAAFPDSRL